MAKPVQRRITNINVLAFGMFQGTFAALIGFGVAVLYSLDQTIQTAQATDSVLQGMAFGLAAGFVSIVVLPFLYFVFGWLLGVLQSVIYNAVLGVSGGVVLTTEDE